MEETPIVEETTEKPPWQPLSAIQRRVVGVMVEKAKTTPSAYPLTLNAIRTACNQKSNRDPIMNLEPDDVENALDELRGLGAIVEVHGDGRVPKYRHMLYDWLGVEKIELAVMAELLLRGAQTVGELRGRVARMDPISDVAALRPILESLASKNLVVPLNAEGRGHAVTHGLYQPEKLQRIKDRFASSEPTPSQPSQEPHRPPSTTEASSPALENRVEQLTSELQELRTQFDDLVTAVRQNTDAIDSVRRDLGG